MTVNHFEDPTETKLREVAASLEEQLKGLKLSFGPYWATEMRQDGSYVATPTLQALATAYSALLKR